MLKQSLIIFLLFSSALCALEFEAKAGFIPDGDTVFVKDGKYKGKGLRLKGIDAPERGQAYSKKSRWALIEKVDKKIMQVVVHEKDKYDRFLVTIYVGKVNINQQMVAEGYAWAYRFRGVAELYEKEEFIAKKQKLGIWSQENPLPPWKFRQRN